MTRTLVHYSHKHQGGLMNQSGNFFTFTYGGIIICQKDRMIKVLYIRESEQNKNVFILYYFTFTVLFFFGIWNFTCFKMDCVYV